MDTSCSKEISSKRSFHTWFTSHTLLSIFKSGAKIKEVQYRLGHSDIQTTMNIYSHFTAKIKESAIQKCESYLKTKGDIE